MKSLIILSFLLSSLLGFSQKYTYQSPFNKSGLAIVAIDQKYGIIDEAGKEILPVVYELVFFTDDDKGITAILNGKTEFMTYTDGKLISGQETENIGTSKNESKKAQETQIGKTIPGQDVPKRLHPEPDRIFIGGLDKESIFIGEEGIRSFFENNLTYPEKAEENGTQGTIIVRFVVEKDGSVTDVKIVGKEFLGNGLEEEAIRVIKKTSGLWKPGEISGNPVRSYFRIPISFRIPEEEEENTYKPDLLTE